VLVTGVQCHYLSVMGRMQYSSP